MKRFSSVPLILGLVLLTSCFGCTFNQDMKEFLTSPPEDCSKSYTTRYNNIPHVVVYEYAELPKNFKEELPCLINNTARTLRKNKASIAFHIVKMNTFSVYHFDFNLDKLSLEIFTKPAYLPIVVKSYSVEKFDFSGALDIIKALTIGNRPSSNLINATTTVATDEQVESYFKYLKTGKN